MLRKLNVFIVVFIFLLLFACSQKRPESDVPVEPAAKTRSEIEVKDAGVREKSGGPRAEDRVRRIAREGEIVFETGDASGTRAFLDKAIRDVDGYLAEEAQNSEHGRIENRLLIRVPADRFDSLVAAITAHVAHIEKKSIKARDVTEEYIDIDARIKSQIDLEKKYQQLLGKAGTLDEVFKINQQIAEVREEIEAAQGKMKYLNDSIMYSRLAVTYYRTGSASIQFFGKIRGGIGNGWRYFALFIIGIVNIWPFILAPALIMTGVLLVMLRRRKRSCSVDT